MSSSYSKSNSYLVAIHRGSLGQSHEEFKTKVQAAGDEWLGIPQMKRNYTRVYMAVANNVLDNCTSAAGIMAARPIVLGITQFENHEDLVEMVEQHGTERFLANHPEFQSDAGASSEYWEVFGAQSQIYIDKESASENRVHGFGILEVPVDGSTQDYEQKMDLIIEQLLKVPVYQKNTLRLTVLRPDMAVDVTDRHNVRAAKYTFIMQAEYENRDCEMEILNDAAFKQFLNATLKAFNGVGVTMGGSDIVSMYQK